MTVKLIPASARKLRAAEETAVSPEAQLFPENRGISLPSAFCSVALSGNRIKICMTLNLRSWRELCKVWLKPCRDSMEMSSF